MTTKERRVHIEADPWKLDKIRDFPTPNSKEDIASFIRLVKTLNNWSRAISMKMEKKSQIESEECKIHMENSTPRGVRERGENR